MDEIRGVCEHPRCNAPKTDRNLFWHSAKLYAPSLLPNGDYFKACNECVMRDYDEKPIARTFLDR